MQPDNPSYRDAIVVNDLEFRYCARGDPYPVFAGLSFRVEEGNWATIIGPAGSGKSTLLKLIKGYILPVGGEIFVHGAKVTQEQSGPKISYIGSDPENQIICTVVEDELDFGLEFLPVSLKERVERKNQVLEGLGIEHLRQGFTSRLSGGEQQRLVLASTLVLRPKVLLLDNSLAMLDQAMRAKCFGFLREFVNMYAMTIVYATTEESESGIGDVTFCLKEGHLYQLASSNFF